MAEDLYNFYAQHCLIHLEKALQRAIGQPGSVVSDAAAFRRLVVDPGWQALPEPIRRRGRDQLQWNGVLFALRSEAFQTVNGKLVFQPNAGQNILARLKALFGTADTPIATPRAAAPKTVPVAPKPKAAEQPAPSPWQQKAAPSVASVDDKCIGIDLGTTYSVVAHVDALGRPCTIHNGAGDLTTPSVILLDESGPIIGKEAVMAATMEPEKIASCVKRDMGARTYRKKLIDEHYPPEVLSAMILRTLKEDAERKLGPLSKAVVTVPAYFDEARRRATLDAGQLAGLEVLGIINEPTAAAIAYGHQLGFLDKSATVIGDQSLNVLVYDLGGGTFDVSIVQIKGSDFRTLATDGDVSLGGKDWDEKLVEHASERVRAELREDPRLNPSTLEELWQAAEVVKKTLTERTKTTMYVNHLGSRHKVEITRQEFEEATASLLGRTRTTTEIVVRQSGLKWTDIDRILLVGGSTRMPMIVRMLEETSGKAPERSVSPDEAVSHGAALYAELLLQIQTNTDSPTSFRITNVNSHSLGIVGVDTTTGRKKNQILIPKNTPLPHEITGTFKTHKANQSNVLIRIVEGESERPEACMQIGTCKVDPLPANLPAGWPIFVKYSYLADGQLRVSAKIKGQDKAVTTVFQRDNNMTEDELEKWQYRLAQNASPIT